MKDQYDTNLEQRLKRHGSQELFDTAKRICAIYIHKDDLGYFAKQYFTYAMNNRIDNYLPMSEQEKLAKEALKEAIKYDKNGLIRKLYDYVTR